MRARVVGKVKSNGDKCEGTFFPLTPALGKREMLAATAIVDYSEDFIPVRVINLSSLRKGLYKGTCLGVVEPSSPEILHTCRNMRDHGSALDVEQTFRKDFESLSPTEAKQLRDILTEYSDVFSRDKMDLGCVQGVWHTIDTGDAMPIACSPRRVPQGLEEKVDQLVDQLLQHNIIQPSNSPWNAPIVIVRKKDGDVRMCVDYRKLNAVTKRPIFPIPEPQHLFDALDGAGYFTTIDFSQGYHQVAVAEEDIPKTAFTTRKGQFEYLRMPFGLCSAPATFQRMMHRVLKHENWQSCLIYLDDVLIFGLTAAEHNERLRAVLQRIREANLKLSPTKCHFFRKEVEYLGHIVSSEGIKTSPAKVEKIKNWPTPANSDELRSFLGLCGYYRKFINDYSSIVAALEKLCNGQQAARSPKQPKSWTWTKLHEDSFAHLKWCLTHAPVLAFPRKEGRFILDTDASHDGIGAVLSQLQDGHERVIAYASHKFSKAERAYCITRKELLSVYRYVLLFKHYLYGRTFTVRTDHQALSWLLNWKRPSTSQYCTWIAELETYDMEIVHRPGRLHINADVLSRLPSCEQCGVKHLDPQKRRAVKNLECQERTAEESERVLCKISASSSNWDQESDPDTQVILLLLRSGRVQEAHPQELSGASETVKSLWSNRAHLRLRGGLLYFRNNKEEYALIVPKSKQAWLIQTTHQTLGHVGVTKTLSALKGRYYWPQMEQHTRLVLNTCKSCAVRKTGNTGIRPQPQKMITGFPFEKIAIDITGPLPPCHSGERFILGVIDCFSKYPALIPLRATDSKTVAHALVKNWISVFGVPHCVHSDRGSNFVSDLFREMCSLFGIKKSQSAPYYPQSDGFIERLFRTAKDMIFATSNSFKRDWKEVLPLVEMGLRSTVQVTTKVSPFEVLFGTTMRLPLLWIDDATAANGRYDDGPRVCSSQYILDLKQRLATVHQKVLENLRRPSKKPSGNVNVKPLCIGTHVMALILPKEKGLLLPRYDGPYIVTGKLGDWTYRLQHLQTKRIIDRNHHHVKPCAGEQKVPNKLPSTGGRNKIDQQRRRLTERQRKPVQRYGFHNL